MKYPVPIFALILGTHIFCGCNGHESSREKIRSVFTEVPTPCGIENTRMFSTSVEEGKSVNVGFKTGGEISKLTVKEGDYVNKGQTIGYLDAADYKLSVNQLESQYRQMQSETDRLKIMYKQGNVSPNDYEKAVSGLEQIKAQLDMTRNKLAYTRLVSPVSGYVVERYMEEGEMVGAGTPIYKIKDNSTLETSVAVPAYIYEHRHDITGCTAKSAAMENAEIPLEIIGFVPDGDNNSLFRLRLQIPKYANKDLIPGMNLSVTLNMNSKSLDGMYEISSRALFNHDGSEYVWVVNPADSIVSAKKVIVVGAPTSGNNIVSGLTGDETVVAVGVNHLSAGEKVKIRGDISKLKQD